ncbi:TonB-dependent receptor [Teredinibacter turnerae]|uniref:TonB-dependent receptor n=1 Tax=Teredinibacter turnerae TaxID=2426 RepID=UPI00037EACBE|nr:TonB-dependent receptor [Teredinibacter turnerae]
MKNYSKLFILLMCFISAIAYADKGSLKILVTDESGKPISGAKIEAKSPDSLGTRTATTDSDGNAKIFGLDPSHQYSVTVSSEGFNREQRTDVIVISDQTFQLEYNLKPVAVGYEEEMVVVGQQLAAVDTTSATVSQDITLDLTESLPTGRNFQSYLQLVPGVKPSPDDNPSSKSGVNYSDAINAEGDTSGYSTDNVYYIEGIDITDNYTGTFGANINSEIIQEQKVITGGIPAEYRGTSGLISNVITKSGGNEFHGSVNYYFQNDGLVSSNKHTEDETSFSTYDAAFTLGGPIIQDKLWFFASYQKKERTEDVQKLDDNTKQRSVTTDRDLGFLKLSWQISEQDRLTGMYFNDPVKIDGAVSSEVINTRNYTRDQGGNNYRLEYSHVRDNLQVSVHTFKHDAELSRTPTDQINPRNDVLFLAGGYVPPPEEAQFGGFGAQTEEFRRKEQYGIKGQWILETGFGSHEFKSGYEMSEAEREIDSMYLGDSALYTSISLAHSGITLGEYINVDWVGDAEFIKDDYERILTEIEASGDYDYYVDLLDADDNGLTAEDMANIVFNSTEGNPNGQINSYRTLMVTTEPATMKIKGKEFYIQDKWNLDKWTVNLGFRAEEWTHYASTGEKIFTFDWEIAPRLSVVYEVTDESKVWAYMGRYFDPIRTDMTSFAGTLTGPLREEQVFIGDRWQTYRYRGGSVNPDAYFAPSTKTPYTDEILIGYSQVITSDITGEITYSRRKTKDLLEDYDLGLYTDPERSGDLALPLSYFGYDELPDSNYVIGTLAGGERKYQGFEFTLRKRKSDNWQMLASYTYNDAEGNSNSDGNADFQGDVIWLDPRAPGMYGEQPGNIKHIFKVAGSYTFDFGLELGASYFWNSGMLYSNTFSASGRHLPSRVETAYEWGGVETQWVDEDSVGSSTTPSYGTLDLRVKYVLDFSRYQAEFFLDIFNALDDQAVTREQDLGKGDLFTQYGDARDWVEPRRMYLGMRFSF